MALSMDEQRVLAEIERRLAAEDPGLAACMTAFKRPGPGAVLRSPRARILGSLFTVLLVAMISLMVYAMIPFRGHTAKVPAGSPGTGPGQTAISQAGTSVGPTPTGTLATQGSQGTSAAAGTSTTSGTGTTTHASTAAGTKGSGAASGGPASASSHHAQSHSTYP